MDQSGSDEGDPTPSAADLIARRAVEVTVEAFRQLEPLAAEHDGDTIHEAWRELFHARQERDAELGEQAKTDVEFVTHAAMDLLVELSQLAREREAGRTPVTRNPLHRAWDAFADGDLADAERRAEALLERVASGRAGKKAGDIVHGANLILGHIRLREGDVDAAERHLLDAGRTSGSAPLNSFGPNMSLALALLRRGRSDSVLEYFDLCGRFWDPTLSDLAKWEATVRRGKIPDFGANVVYGTGRYDPDDDENVTGPEADSP